MKKTSISNSKATTTNPSQSSMLAPFLFALIVLVASSVPVSTSAQMMTNSVISYPNQANLTNQTDIVGSSVASISWPEIEAKSAFIYDPVSNQIVYEKNADIQRPTASLLKIMTAATAEKLLATVPSLVEKKLTIPKMKDLAASDFSLPTGSTWLPDNLMQIMLIGSSNKAAETIASQLIPRSSFISLMNFNAKQMGLTQTYFRNPSGLTEETPTISTKVSIIPQTSATSSTEGQLDIAAGVSTAREMAKLMWTVISQNPGLLDITNHESLTIGAPKTAKNVKGTTIIANTNKILSDFPIVFGKTGFTENAGGNLAIVMQKNVTSRPYVIVVLGSSIDSRFDDVAKLASTTLQLINLQDTVTLAKSTATTTINIR
ncbi:MAG: hypothetical protein K9M11_01045 [Candidatus Pacebacteria bacterium]|nr:hypothetical protein [Candidatus Paceibacterota bacterium]